MSVPVCDVGRPDGSSAGRLWQEYGASIGRCEARGWWFSGFKLVLTATADLLPDRVVLIPAAGDEREAAAALLTPGMVLIGDRNFSRYASPTWRDALDHAGVTVIAPPPRRYAADQDPAERAFLAAIRNRVETLIGLLLPLHTLPCQHRQGRCTERERRRRLRAGNAAPLSWAVGDSNPGPHGCEPCALTN